MKNYLLWVRWRENFLSFYIKVVLQSKSISGSMHNWMFNHLFISDQDCFYNPNIESSKMSTVVILTNDVQALILCLSYCITIVLKQISSILLLGLATFYWFKPKAAFCLKIHLRNQKSKHCHHPLCFRRDVFFDIIFMEHFLKRGDFYFTKCDKAQKISIL